MNEYEEQETNSGFIIETKRAPIRYIGPKEVKPKYVEFGPTQKREVTEEHKLAISKSRTGKKYGPYNKGEKK